MQQITEQEQRVLARVLQMLGSGNALSQDLEDYVVGFHVLGRLVALAQADVELIEQQRKVAFARAFAEAKSSEERVSDRVAESLAEVAVEHLRFKEVRAREKWTNLKNTRESVEQAINAIKYLGRNGG